MKYNQIRIDYDELFKKIQKESYVDPNKELQYPPIAISKGSTGGPFDYPLHIATYGNFSFIQAPPKNKKTFFLCLMASVYLSDKNEFGKDILGKREDRKLIHYDTEQGEFHAQKTFNRIVKMAETDKNYLPFALRKYSAKERLEFINWHLYKEENIGLVIIDGIADLINDVNDIEASSDLVQYLMKWTQELNIHIMTVIHSNWNSDKPTGHLGSFLEKKTETQIALKNDSEDDSLVLVKCKRSRGYSFNDFVFRINSDNYPEVVGDLPSLINGDPFINI